MQSESDYIQEFKKRLMELKPIKISKDETPSLQREIYVESNEENQSRDVKWNK